MKFDVDHALESLSWIRQMRGDTFVDQLAYSIQVNGPRAILADVLHHTMSDDEQEAYAAAIKFIEWSSLAAA